VVRTGRARLHGLSFLSVNFTQMNVFIVYAHAESRSFNGALFQTAQQTLRAAGHAVVTSDLYAMKFDPGSDQRNFTTVKSPEFFKQQIEEMFAGFGILDVIGTSPVETNESGLSSVDYVGEPTAAGENAVSEQWASKSPLG
jgi:NAD(P)H dehydrogenase (quinone)